MVIETNRDRVLHAVLERQAVSYGNRTFLYFNDREFSYQDFNREAGRVACALQRLGVAKGDKVAIVMDNCPEFLFLWFGLSKLGAIEVPINTAHKGEVLSYMMRQSDSCLLIVQSRYLDRVVPVLAEADKVKTVVVLDEGAGGTLVGADITVRLGAGLGKRVLDWVEIVDNDGSYRPAEVTWSDPYAILYTSGTTGLSKGVLMPHNLAINSVENLCRTINLGEGDCVYNVLPLFHNGAQLLSAVPALMVGARLVLAERFSASRFWDDVRRHGCTECSYTGGITSILYNSEPRPDDADNPLRVMLGGGIPRDIHEAFEKRFGVPLIEFYGMTETGPPTMNDLVNRKPGSCGRLHPNYTVKVVDDDGLEVGPNTPGELLVRSSTPYSMLLEYYGMPEKTVEAWRDLWFHTGDCLSYDEEGYFYFMDRKKDAMRRRGENISSYEVERVVNSHPAVLESAAVAVKSGLGDDEVLVCLTLNPGESLTPLELTAYCEERMAYFMVPRYLRFMESMPKTPTLRIQKQRLRDDGVTVDTWDREKAGYKLKR